MLKDQNKNEIFNDLVKIFQNSLNITNLNMQSDLSESLKLDSIQLLTLVTEIENHYAINLPVTLEGGLSKISDLVDIIYNEISNEKLK